MLAVAASMHAQTAAPGEVVRQEGTDGASGIHWVLLSIFGTPEAATDGNGKDAAQPVPPPRLTALCSGSPDGKPHFDLLADLGGVPEIRFLPPWHATPSQAFPPPVQHDKVTMDFIGYTHVSPARRTFDRLPELPGELEYTQPARNSPNLEPAAYFLRYLRALPLLRLTASSRAAASFATAPWLAAIAHEPQCKAAGLA